MPALAFGLKGTKTSLGAAKPPQKRKAVFDDAGSDDDNKSFPKPPTQSGANKSSRPIKPLQPLKDDTSSDEDNDSSTRPAKSPKLSHPAPSAYGLQKKTPITTSDRTPAPAGAATTTSKDSGKDKYTNFSSLRSARLHDAQAAQLDASVYDYDGVYDTFQATSNTNGKASKDSTSEKVPKYMTSLLKSTEQRKRDHERAREKAVQRERENEGDEFRDKESFVTGAYKKQQEEMRRQEEEEEKRLAAEEELRRKQGGGMVGFRKKMLEKEEERMRAIAEAEEQLKKDAAVGKDNSQADATEEVTEDADRKAKELNEHGARIALNEEGEVIDKRQLLSAGLNVAPKKPAATPASSTSAKSASHGGADAADRRHAGGRAGDSRAAQRERQTRMVERQLEAAAAAQAGEEEREERERAQRNASRIGEAEKLGARERYLARKREREAEAAEGKRGLKKGGEGGEGGAGAG